MKSFNLQLKQFLFFSFSLFLVFTNVNTSQAQAQIEIWSVDEAHLIDHHQGTSYYVDCGQSDYFFYPEDGNNVEKIYKLVNIGDATLNLNLPLQMEAGFGNEFSIISQPAASIPAGGHTSFRVLYNTPPTYVNSQVTIPILSNANPSNCEISIEVGGSCGELGCAYISGLPEVNCIVDKVEIAIDFLVYEGSGNYNLVDDNTGMILSQLTNAPVSGTINLALLKKS